ncbi:hypothetical protein [Roseovarius nanhaiticus]|uniref:Uncharacterized protein n=1 Tax=Roseovarius nanhaiticus TaxID=573024 RepID=A0A1N7G711_9RHOB|nr:hypothetical protein [Roseovarius nanhaiticus]SEK35549.1 hypothetical protein SAMN05216208_0405 [Roseovarius nanhaiticus]SIS08352.1 hypothetical protein SAMN05421666_1731 [Roseovarius nanhaiticus]
MSDIDAMQSRIMAALDRIGQGLDGMGGNGAEPQDEDKLAKLTQQVEDEKLANAQLEERVKQLSARAREAEAKLADLEAAGRASKAEEDTRTKMLRKVEGDLQSLRHANQQLRDNNAKLREANAKGVAEPHLINKAMMAELDGLRASRAADRTEMDAILGELARIGDAAGADGQGKEDA